MAAGAGGESNLNRISSGAKIQVLGQAMYGYGYSTPWSWRFEEPRVHCGNRDFAAALEVSNFICHCSKKARSSYSIKYFFLKNGLAFWNCLDKLVSLTPGV